MHTVTRTRLWISIAAVLLTAASTPASAEPEIVWRVVNPFRFFLDAKASEIHRATFESLTEEERRTPILAAERALAERHSEGWAATMFRETCWNVASNRHVCPQYADYAHPKSHKVRLEIADVPEARTVDCQWLTAPVGTRQRGTAATLPCNQPVELDIPYPGGARVSVEIGGRQVADTRVVVSDLFIVGLGDSFASGEGNPDAPVRFSNRRDNIPRKVREANQPLPRRLKNNQSPSRWRLNQQFISRAN